MCKPSCRQPKGGSGTGTIIAVITGIILATSLLPVILGLLKLLALITAASIGAIAVLGLTACAIKAWHHRTTTGRQHPIRPVRQAPALPPGYVLVITNDPGTGLSGRVLPGSHGRIAGHLTGTLANHDDLAVVDDLIRRVLRGHHT